MTTSPCGSPLFLQLVSYFEQIAPRFQFGRGRNPELLQKPRASTRTYSSGATETTSEADSSGTASTSSDSTTGASAETRSSSVLKRITITPWVERPERLMSSTGILITVPPVEISITW